jgi:hypothetical protein
MALLFGTAIVDSVQASSQAPTVTIAVRDSAVRIHTPGEYELDFSPPQLKVSRGEAEVVRNGQSTTLRAAEAAWPLVPGAAGQPPAESDTLLDIWSANRRIALSSHLSGSSQPEQPLAGPDNDVSVPSSVTLGLLPLTGIYEPLYTPIRPYRPGSQFFGPGYGYWNPYYTYPEPAPHPQRYRPIEPLPPSPGPTPVEPGFVGGTHVPGPVIGH